MTQECKSCGAKWNHTWSSPPLWLSTLVQPSNTGRGKDLVGKKLANSEWLKLVPLEEDKKKRVLELMETYLPKCPICKSKEGYEIGRNLDSFLLYFESIFPYRLVCKSCGAVLVSGEWDEGDQKEHVLKLDAAARGSVGVTLLRQEHSVKFWQNMDIEELETPEDVKNEVKWVKKKLEEIYGAILLPPAKSEIVWDTLFRYADPLGALALRGLPADPMAPLNELKGAKAQWESAMQERAQERTEKYERIVFKSKCPKCGKKISEEFGICPYCGYKLKHECSSCKKEVSPDFDICPYCGEKLKF